MQRACHLLILHGSVFAKKIPDSQIRLSGTIFSLLAVPPCLSVRRRSGHGTPPKSSFLYKTSHLAITAPAGPDWGHSELVFKWFGIRTFQQPSSLWMLPHFTLLICVFSFLIAAFCGRFLVFSIPVREICIQYSIFDRFVNTPFFNFDAFSILIFVMGDRLFVPFCFTVFLFICACLTAS